MLTHIHSYKPRLRIKIDDDHEALLTHQEIYYFQFGKI